MKKHLLLSLALLSFIACKKEVDKQEPKPVSYKYFWRCTNYVKTDSLVILPTGEKIAWYKCTAAVLDSMPFKTN